MKNPYDSYLLRHEKPKVIGLYCGKPVLSGFFESEEFERMKRDADIKKRHQDALIKFCESNQISVDDTKGASSSKHSTAFAGFFAGLLLGSLW